MGKQIIELQGNKFKVGPRYKFYLGPPEIKNSKYIMTRDRISNIPFILVIKLDTPKYYMLQWVEHLDMYILQDLVFIEYLETLDIKYEWKHRKELKEWYDKQKYKKNT